MGIFNKKNEVETNITFEDTPSGKRKYNVLLDVVNSITETKPEVALALTENIPESPALYRVRGWAFADHLSENELSRMLYLFIKELDKVDDELIEMIKAK